MSNLTCPACAAQLRVPSDFAGERGRCPRCGTPIFAVRATQEGTHREDAKIAKRNEPIPLAAAVRLRGPPSASADRQADRRILSLLRPLWGPIRKMVLGCATAAGIAVSAVIVLAVLVRAMYFFGVGPPATLVVSHFPSDREAWQAAVQLSREHLLEPSTARFAAIEEAWPDTISRPLELCWWLGNWVETRDESGTFARRRYFATISYPVRTGEWRLDQFHVYPYEGEERLEHGLPAFLVDYTSPEYEKEQAKEDRLFEAAVEAAVKERGQELETREAFEKPRRHRRQPVRIDP